MIDREEDAVQKMMSGHRFVFLCGLHRSGTSLAFRCLREHPKISGFKDTGAPHDEGQHLQSVFPKAFQHGGPAKFGFAPEMTLDETSPLITPANRRKLFEEWSRYWNLHQPYLLEKSPPNLIKTRFLQAVFPNTYFILILRHPVAVTLATRKWKPFMPLNRFFDHWLICHEKMRDDLGHLHHTKLIHYEDFVANPYDILAEIYEFLCLEPVPTSEEVRPNVNEKYFEKWREVSRGILGRTKTRRLAKRYEDRIRSFGYSLSDLNDPASTGRIN